MKVHITNIKWLIEDERGDGPDAAEYHLTREALHLPTEDTIEIDDGVDMETVRECAHDYLVEVHSFPVQSFEISVED